MHIIYIIGRKFQAMAKSGILPTLIGASLSEKTRLPYIALILGISDMSFIIYLIFVWFLFDTSNLVR